MQSSGQVLTTEYHSKRLIRSFGKYPCRRSGCVRPHIGIAKRPGDKVGAPDFDPPKGSDTVDRGIEKRVEIHSISGIVIP